MGTFDKVNNYIGSYSDLIRGLLVLTLANFGNLVQKLFFCNYGQMDPFYSLDLPP